jgi:hypothetical protein
MPSKGLFLQNVIAVIWDFDRTLSPDYMQRPLFEEYGVDEAAFWREVNALPAYYARGGVHVQRDTCYLGHLLSYVRHGAMPGLTNQKLRELGGRIRFFEGVPDIFQRLEAIVQEDAFLQGDVKLEHYVVSTGLAEMVRGSAAARYIKDVWASEFIQEPAEPGSDLDGEPGNGPISQIAGFLDNTTKTRALFEINKGVNVEPGISVNDSIPEEERRVPFSNMIYIADGPSDIPSFSVVRRNGGRAYAVYAPGDMKQFEQVANLQEDQRVNACGPADYSEGTPTDLWLQLQVRTIARGIMERRRSALANTVRKGPEHID